MDNENWGEQWIRNLNEVEELQQMESQHMELKGQKVVNEECNIFIFHTLKKDMPFLG